LYICNRINSLIKKIEKKQTLLTARLTEDKEWVLVEGDQLEIRQLRLCFTKKINSWFIIKNKNPQAEVEEKFMNNFGLIPVGLWIELIKACERFNYQISFIDDFDKKIRNNISYDTFNEYISELFKNSSLTPRDYQIDGVYKMIEYMRCCVEVSTSGGKTLMAYMLFRFMKDFLHFNHILFITPKTNLTTQSVSQFVKYDNQNQMLTDWTYSEVHAQAKKKEKYDDNIVFGNYQSLCRKSNEFFEKFDAVIIDECHHAISQSIRKIIRKCVNAKYKIGMTGTFPEDDSYDNFVLSSYVGPVVFRLPSYELIESKKSATPVYINSFFLKYLDYETLKGLYSIRSVSKSDDPTIGNKILAKEREIARDSTLRLSYICDMIGKTTKNTLVIFSDVENGYGKRIYDRVKESTDKTCFYIDGNTNTRARNEMKQAMEDDLSGNTIIVASMGCFSEGIDIANMWNIFLVETTKSDTILAQILGRGMRKFEGKERTIMIDFVDDFRFGNGYYQDNYLFKHGCERLEIYKKRGFPCNTFQIDLSQHSLF
jgi:superfamily II DNA or RNA helicase